MAMAILFSTATPACWTLQLQILHNPCSLSKSVQGQQWLSKILRTDPSGRMGLPASCHFLIAAAHRPARLPLAGHGVGN